jgi:hypothetical protein
MKFHMEIQSEHFGQGRDLSIEGNAVKFLPVGKTQTKTHVYSFLNSFQAIRVFIRIFY